MEIKKTSQKIQTKVKLVSEWTKGNIKWIAFVIILIIAVLIGRMTKSSGDSRDYREWQKEKKFLLDSANKIHEEERKLRIVLEDKIKDLEARVKRRDRDYDSLKGIKITPARKVSEKLTNEQLKNLAIKEYEKATGDIINDN